MISMLNIKSQDIKYAIEDLADELQLTTDYLNRELNYEKIFNIKDPVDYIDYENWLVHFKKECKIKSNMEYVFDRLFEGYFKVIDKNTLEVWY